MLKIETYCPSKYTDFIERIWILENQGEDIDLMIPPNQYINLVFPIGCSNYVFNNKKIEAPQLEGISLQTNSLNYPAKTKLVGIRFYPYGLSYFLKIQGKEILNKSRSINTDLRSTSISGFDNQKLTSNEILEEVYRILDMMFEEKQDGNLYLIKEFYEQYRNGDSQESIEDFCINHQTNYSTLNRHFLKVTGLSPKRFERLIKFRKSLCSLIDNPKELTKIGLDSGYFDQAHFIREFKLFLNHTPSSYQSLIHSADKDSNIVNYNFRIF